MDKKHLGAKNELVATVWLLENGYEVFRNVSQHGMVDLVAMKAGDITLLDVKKLNRGTCTRLSQEQVDAGVKLLAVYEDDGCEIIEAPARRKEQKVCDRCSAPFMAYRARQRFCSTDCSGANHREYIRARKARLELSADA